MSKGVHLNGMWARTRKEWHYITRKSWTLQEVRDHWDETDDYDDINAETYSYFRRFIDGLEACTLAENLLVLDICCRTGNGTLYFHQHGRIRKAICADVSPRFLEIAGANLTQAGIAYETICFEHLPLPIPEGSVEAVLCFETLEHMPDPENFVKELGRVIQPGGEMILTTPNILWEPVHWLAAIIGLHHSEGPHRFLSHRRLIRAVTGAGFKIEKNLGTVLVPDGPEWLTRFGLSVEKRFPQLARWLALRRILICYRT